MELKNEPEFNIALDYDGVISDTNSLKSDWIKKNLRINIPPWKCSYSSLVPEIMDEKKYNEMVKVIYCKEILLNTQPVHGAIEGLHALSEIGAVYIVTARPRKRLSWTIEWLKRYNIYTVIKDIFSTEFPAKRTKKDICFDNRIHVLIDDESMWINDFSDLEIPFILFKSGAPKSEQKNSTSRLNHGIEWVNSWSKIVNRVKKIEQRHRAGLYM